MLKKIIITLYIVVVAVLAIATIVEKYEGTPYVADHIYGAWWFSALWALLSAAAIFYFIRRRVGRPSVVALHGAMVVILAGALLTHLTARQGMLHLREGQTASRYATDDGEEQALPFTVVLDHFRVVYHEGTQAPSDFVSTLTITDGSTRQQATVSMNQIASFDGIRLYQASYDDDMRGSVLAVNSDPLGIPVTYTGYALLFVSLIWMLIDPRGTYRQLLRRAAASTALSETSMVASASTATSATSAATCRSLALALLFAAGCDCFATPRSLPQETADRFARLFVVYNDRVCPMETYALDFTKKLTGRRHYGDFSAAQVLTGFIFFYDDWSREPVIRVKGSEMKQRLHLPDQASLATFFGPDGYKLGPHLGNKDVQKIDERVSLIMELHQGRPLKIFPYSSANDPKSSTERTNHTSHLSPLTSQLKDTSHLSPLTSQLKNTSHLTWYSPTDVLPDSMDAEHRKYIRDVFTRLNGEIQAGRFDRANQYLDKMLEYQQTFGAASLPSLTRVEAEHIYNKVPFATILFMVCLTLGFASFLLMLFLNGRESARWLYRGQLLALLLCWLTLTAGLALRWVVTGHVPMANGYETMLFLAWVVMLLAMVASRHFRIMLTFGLLLAGFFLLASHISQMDPKITHLMPVLNSPLLTLHVSIIMMAYALLALTFVSSLTALLMPLRTKRRDRQQAACLSEQMQLLSQLMLYPALACLGFGIFIGAIWANVSWGTYWSWDPKETWALITFMVYAVPAHRSLFTSRSSLQVYHIYMVLAFLTILMTYFGVNYFLGGMHSYA